MTRDARRDVPRTDAVLADERLADAQHVHGRVAVKREVVAALQHVRESTLAAGEVVDAVLLALADGPAAAPRHVLNATGVVVHTNLGRAPLSDAAVFDRAYCTTPLCCLNGWLITTSPSRTSISALGAPPPTPTISPKRIDGKLFIIRVAVTAAGLVPIWPAGRHVRTTLCWLIRPSV